jgi:hypothetical protein
MSAGEEGDQHPFEDLRLADHHLTPFLSHPAKGRAEVLDLRRHREGLFHGEN